MAGKIEMMICPVEVFDGNSNFGHWKAKMENFFRVIRVSDVVQTGFNDPETEENLTEVQKKELYETRQKDELAKMWITMRVSSSVYENIMHEGQSKSMWDMLCSCYQGNNKVKKVRLQTLRCQFELLEMGKSESISDYFTRTLGIVNHMKTNGESTNDEQIVQKTLRNLKPDFNYVVAAIEESKDLTTISVEDLMGSLQAHEQRFKDKSESVVFWKMSE